MGKKSRRHRVRLEKDQAGCMWGLISVFDFRHARFTKNLLLDRNRRSKHSVVSPHGGYPKGKLNMLVYSEENQTTEDLEENKSSVKELMEEEMFNDQDLKKDRSSTDVQMDQLTSDNGGRFREKPTKAQKYRSKSCDVQHIMDWGGGENQILDKETARNLDMEIILEEFCRLNQKSSYLKQVWQDDTDLKSNEVSVIEERLGAAIKVFISQKFSNNRNLVENGKTHRSIEFMDALQTLSSNKEMLFELLQNPNSLLVKHIQSVDDMEDANLHANQSTSSLSGFNLSKEPSKPRLDELSNHKHLRIFRRRSKSQDSNSFKYFEECQPSSRIVILKPGSAAPQSIITESIFDTSVQSHPSMDDKPQGEKNFSHFSMNEIKRKLKHAMRKERRGVSLDGSEFYNLKNHEKGVGEGNGGWSSPNRNHFYTERFAKSPLGTKRGDKTDMSKKSETTTVNETIENTKQGAPSFYVEAKQHLLEMLSNGDEKDELLSRKLPESLGRILSLPEYSFTPNGGPIKDKEDSFLTPKMRLSAGGNIHMVNENTWRLVQDDRFIQLISPKQNLDNQSFITDEKHEEKVKQLISNADGLCELNQGISTEETVSCTEERSREELPESVRTTNSDIEEYVQVSDVSCNSSISLFSKEIQNCDAAEVSEMETNPKCFELESMEEDEFLSSPPVSPTSPSVTGRDETVDTSIDRTERPSPISVLEPLFSEDDISPSSTKLKHAAKEIQPLQIHFEERVPSDTDRAVCTRTCMENKESAFEYVEAVLLGSGLNWDEFLMRWLSSDQILDPSLFDEVQLFSSRSSHDQKLLFDFTNNVLEEVCERYFVRSFVEKNIRPVPVRMNLINEVWEGVERNIVQHPVPRSLDQLVRKELSKHGLWMDLCFETDLIAIELEKSILEEMMEDMILSFAG